jgi:replication fork clamp-binding protein CrfC
MPRVCTICTRPEREAIDRALVGGTACREVAALYRVSPDAVERHKAAHLPKTLTEARQAADGAHALDVMEELQRCFQRVNLLFDACDRWLRDADDPARYDIGPRAGDILVTYEQPGDDGRPQRRKESLDRLLARVEDSGVALERWDTKYADPRELVLKTAQQLTGQTQLLAKLLGQLDERPQVNVLMAPEWLQVRAALLMALAPHPEARRAVAAALVSFEAGPVTGAA